MQFLEKIANFALAAYSCALLLLMYHQRVLLPPAPWQSSQQLLPRVWHLSARWRACRAKDGQPPSLTLPWAMGPSIEAQSKLPQADFQQATKHNVTKLS